MKGKTLVVLSVVAVLAALTALWLGRDSTTASLSDNGTYLFPGFNQQINQAEQIRLLIGGSGQTVTLDRESDGWSVSEKHGYAADAGAIRKLLLKLSEARVIEPKTANPALYPRLGVEDVSADTGSGVLLEVDGPAASPRLIVGEVETLAGRGTYVRRQGEAESYLISEELRPGRSPERWLELALLDVPPELLRAVTIRHADGEEVTLVGIDGHLVLLRVPEGRELSSPSATSPISRGLENLKLEDVLPESDFDGGEPTAEINYRLVDGRQIDVRAWQTDAGRFVALDMGMTLENGAAAGKEDGAGVQQDHKGDASPPPDVPRADPEAVARRSESLAGWVFRISVPRYEQLVRRSEDLLMPPPAGS